MRNLHRQIVFSALALIGIGCFGYLVVRQNNELTVDLDGRIKGVVVQAVDAGYRQGFEDGINAFMLSVAVARAEQRSVTFGQLKSEIMARRWPAPLPEGATQ